jgi:hypothetical protein
VGSRLNLKCGLVWLAVLLCLLHTACSRSVVEKRSDALEGLYILGEKSDQFRIDDNKKGEINSTDELKDCVSEVLRHYDPDASMMLWIFVFSLT